MKMEDNKSNNSYTSWNDQDYEGFSKDLGRIAIKSSVFSFLFTCGLCFILFFMFHGREYFVDYLKIIMIKPVNIRFEDLNKYDSISGYVYIISLISFATFTSWMVYKISKRYIHYWGWRDDNYKPIGRNALWGAFFRLIFSCFFVYTFYFYNLEVSEKKYIGYRVFFLFYSFPFLSSLAVVPIGIFMSDIVIAIAKYRFQNIEK
nr:hypothetical protein [Stappia sp. MMSF_3263]